MPCPYEEKSAGSVAGEFFAVAAPQAFAAGGPGEEIDRGHQEEQSDDPEQRNEHERGDRADEEKDCSGEEDCTVFWGQVAFAVGAFHNAR